MSLGDYVRVCRAFVEVFKWAEIEGKLGEGNIATSGSEEEDEQVVKYRCALVNDLRQDLKVGILESLFLFWNLSQT